MPSTKNINVPKESHSFANKSIGMKPYKVPKTAFEKVANHNNYSKYM